ncbi:MAG: leucyl aminopeptidase [Myxococcales bacterium]|nr:leucyl aminopeptidase [Myxococcales bacterium]
MNFSLVSGDASRLKGEVLVLPLFESDLSDRRKAPDALLRADRKLKGLLVKSARAEGFRGKSDQLFAMHTQGRVAAGKVILVGLGERAKFEPEVLRLAAGKAVKAANKMRAKSAVFWLPTTRDFQQCVKAAVEGLSLGAYRFERYRTTNKEERAAPRVERVQLLLPPGQEKDQAVQQAVELGQRVAEATNWARDLVNEPAAALTPARLAEEARQAAEAAELKISVGGRKEIESLKMGLFLGVSQGSGQEPKLIHLSYTPKDPDAAKLPPLALVGKAITFDSGGLSLKTADSMVDMKTDMAGAAAVLGAMRVVGALKPPFPVHALMGACENMPSGTAYRPGDVLTSRLGKTVEVTNTDAEGRLVLADMLAYACELKPSAIVDVATLTGACIIALGHFIAGAFGEDDQVVWSLIEAARAAGEEVWRMPVSQLQKEALRSEVADLKNSGERWGAAINAALFLKEFVGETPWVHLDIAGPSQSPKERGYLNKGATGIGVRTLVELIRRRSDAVEGPEAPEPEPKMKPAGKKATRAAARGA